MILRHAARTTVYAGEHAWPLLRKEISGRALVVADAAVAVDPGSLPVIRLDAGNVDLRTVSSLADQLAEHAPETVVGIGGGSVLDMVKLAGLVHADPGMRDVLAAWGRRAGVIALPAGRDSGPRRIFVPTTIGTGVEVSPVACVLVDGHKRIVTGDRLRPDTAVLDPACTAGLPDHLLREGVLEALLRILGPVAGSPPVGGLPDAEARALAGHLVAIGDRLAAGETGARIRLQAAMASAATHTGWSLSGRYPFSAKHWYLANELSTVLGLRKMTATAMLLPAVWSRIEAGDRRYGDPAQLAMAWRWVDDSAPVAGLRALLRRWQIGGGPRPSSADLGEAARRAVTSWGGRLPMLAGLPAAEIEALYAEAAREVLPCST